jgi:hypothetical protein
VIERVSGAVVGYFRRNPVTAGYLVFLLLTHLVVDHVLSAGTSHRLLLDVSTNLENLRHDPLGVLIGSALLFDGTLTHVLTLSFVSTLITLVLGIGGMLAWLERRWGAARAYAVFAAGHVGATLITSQVIRYALERGWYPQSVRHTLDFGISYGAQAVLATVVMLMPRTARPFWAAFVVAWPVVGADWSGPIPDFTTVGHLTAAAIGFACALGAAIGSRRGRSAEPQALAEGVSAQN